MKQITQTLCCNSEKSQKAQLWDAMACVEVVTHRDTTNFRVSGANCHY